MQMEDRLPRAWTDVRDHAVVLQAGVPRDLRDELEHPFRLVRRKLADLAQALDVPVRDHEQMDVGLRIDVSDGVEPIRAGDVVAFGREPAEEAVVRQRGSPPP